MRKIGFLFSLVLCVLYSPVSAQRANNWYFGINAGINFSTSPPTLLSNGTLFTQEGCSSVSDLAGNLLFYSDGDTIFDQNHSVMANGAGLAGHPSTSQAALIVHHPATSNLYYVFTQDAQAGGNGFRYSIVDMSLAAGLGSVTVKNFPIHTPSTEKIAAARHCNGSDIWVVSHDFNSSTFRTLLVTAAGVSSTAVLSPVGSTVTGININTLGCMKISPNGKKLIIANYNTFELFDFDNTTGIVSNPVFLTSALGAYGCEFSPDGTKLYASSAQMYRIWQWDLCAGSNSAIVASQYTMATQQSPVSNIQLAPDGKIYGARFNKQDLAVINNPNVLGAGCSFVEAGFSISPMFSLMGLPGFMSGYLRVPPPFTHTFSCRTASFTSPPTPTFASSCGGSADPVLGTQWIFGDPSSGGANTSTLSDPTHSFTSSGNHTVSLVRYFQCSSDTFRAVIQVPAAPNLSVSGSFTICKGQTNVLSASGASSYLWNGTSATTPTIALSPTITSTFSVTGTSSLGCSSTTAFTIYVSNCVSSEGEIKLESVKIYPVSANGVYTFETSVPTTLLIFSQTGNQVYEGTFETGRHRIDISSSPSGIYLVRTSDRRLRSTRIIKCDQ